MKRFADMQGMTFVIRGCSCGLLATVVALILVTSHTDNTGSLEYNMSLSAQRAAAVVRELTVRGIDAARLAARGAGPLAPVASNSSEDGRAKNRRVELVAR